MGEVQIVESLVFSVVDFLKEGGYNLGSATGCKEIFDYHYNASTSELGILKPPPRNILSFLKRDIFLGVLFMNASDWMIEIYGRENLTEGKELANKLSEKFNKKIVVTLSTEESKKETFLIRP